jgi:hypothetical protein
MSKGKGSCDQVKKIVEDLRNAGNSSCFGVIDWDCTNEYDNKTILVHGRRYSLENYLFDPIYIVCLFLKNENAHSIRKELNFEESYQEYALINDSQERLQECADWVLNKVEQASLIQSSVDKVDVEYANGILLKYPKWLLESKGHDLLSKFSKAFSFFDGKNEAHWQEQLSRIAIRCYPLISKDTVEMIKGLGGLQNIV